MDAKRAKEILDGINKREAKSRRGREYFKLLRNRDDATEAFEAIIDKSGSRNLFANHELIRKEDGRWIWSNTKKK